MNYCLIAFLCLLVSSCSPNSSAEFIREGQARCEMFARDLEQIENRRQLLGSEEQLKMHFESLVSLMIQAKEFQRTHEDDISFEMDPLEWGQDIRLENELRRIYTVEGGREIVERAQHEALVRLDAYMRRENNASKRSLR